MGAVIITKSPSVLMKPSEPPEPVTEPAGRFINLSPYDKPYVGIPVTAFLVFDQQIDGDPVETIKRGLSKALLYYYPMCGRLAAGVTPGEVVVECTGEGVPLVAASASCSLNDVQQRLHDDPSLQEELAVLYPAGRGPGLHTDPLLLMQVTVFSCGGFVVGLTWDHSIADGAGMGQFMEAVGELSRGLPSPSVIPVRSDDTFTAMPQTALRFLTLFLSLYSLHPSPLVFLHIRVPSSLINRIKQDFTIATGGSAQTTCSVFEAVTAVLWQFRTRAVMEDPEAPAMLSFAINARKYAGAKHGYYGNCVVAALVTTTCGVVANGDVVDVIKMIRHAKDQISGAYSDDGHDDDLQEEIVDAKSLLGYNYLAASSWRNLGIETVDFGGGRPARVMVHAKSKMSIPICAPCLPWNNDDFFSVVVSRFVKEEHAGAFLRQLANFT